MAALLDALSLGCVDRGAERLPEARTRIDEQESRSPLKVGILLGCCPARSLEPATSADDRDGLNAAAGEAGSRLSGDHKKAIRAGDHADSELGYSTEWENLGKFSQALP
jgi:hypothetical protein